MAILVQPDGFNVDARKSDIDTSRIGLPAICIDASIRKYSARRFRVAEVVVAVHLVECGVQVVVSVDI